MNEVFLETLIDLVSNNEKTTQEIKGLVKDLPDHSPALGQIDARLEGMEKEVQDIPNRISMPIAEILILQQLLQDHCQQLMIPLKKEVRHEHHMSKPVRWYIVLNLIILGLILLEYHTWMTARRHQENDIKYRYLQVFQDAQGRDYLHNLDSQYNLNPDQFRKDVIQKEDHNKEQLEKLQRLEEQKEEVKELEKEAKEQPVGPRKKVKSGMGGK